MQSAAVGAMKSGWSDAFQSLPQPLNTPVCLESRTTNRSMPGIALAGVHPMVQWCASCDEPCDVMMETSALN